MTWLFPYQEASEGVLIVHVCTVEQIEMCENVTNSEEESHVHMDT